MDRSRKLQMRTHGPWRDLWVSLMADAQPNVFGKSLDILVDDGYIRQTTIFDDKEDTRIYQDTCTICDIVVWEYVGQYHTTNAREIAEEFSPNSPKYHVSQRCAAHFYNKHPDELALATMKASI